MKSCLIILVFLCCFITCSAQVSNKFEQPKSGRLVQNQPSAFITFEKNVVIPPRYLGESENQILLRFHNNSIWNMTVSVNGCRPEQEQCMAFYEVFRLPTYEDKIKESDVPAGYGYGLHVSSARTVKSSGSFLFNVSKESLAEGLYIRVDFSYEWESTGNSGGRTLEIIHQVSFFSWQLPKVEK